ncbi:hypothetical protein [Lacipirellula limnantheis]|uniref:Uncharacterized protein n=1 Tax=Lacipirellula limnantheis TaxID=2528024 RepID=A0A517U3D0_9BACT|nr:hypothetical protein [Lacipirellula limnantheis]QDT75128.1 hypothetical protein I41_43370 [Lacipirellula limnantheis]
MSEKDFWSKLEYRLSRELAGLAIKHKGTLWCDGIAPTAILGTDSPPRIEGEAWIGTASNDLSLWRFTLFLPVPVNSRDEINWNELLPPEDQTYWVAIDAQHRILQIEPEAAKAWSDRS